MNRPLFASKETLAEMLDISPSTVDAYVRDGILPRPIRLTDRCMRFDCDEVAALVRSRKLSLGTPASNFAKDYLDAQDRKLLPVRG